MNSPTRDVSTLFKQGISNKHSCGTSLAVVECMSILERREYMGELQKAVQSHKCCKYYLKDKVCRFRFPLQLVEKTHVMIEENVLVKQLREIPEDQEDDNPNLGPFFLMNCITRLIL